MKQQYIYNIFLVLLTTCRFSLLIFSNHIQLASSTPLFMNDGRFSRTTTTMSTGKMSKIIKSTSKATPSRRRSLVIKESSRSRRVGNNDNNNEIVNCGDRKRKSHIQYPPRGGSRRGGWSIDSNKNIKAQNYHIIGASRSGFYLCDEAKHTTGRSRRIPDGAKDSDNAHTVANQKLVSCTRYGQRVVTKKPKNHDENSN
mmetsp:Transcript_14454/g.17572  ORF Transcript_14454/g.17572 Transcript_14454/m.17572 type:complete len:199 (+) Transcript_14454:70-666(+)